MGCFSRETSCRGHFSTRDPTIEGTPLEKVPFPPVLPTGTGLQGPLVLPPPQGPSRLPSSPYCSGQDIQAAASSQCAAGSCWTLLPVGNLRASSSSQGSPLMLQSPGAADPWPLLLSQFPQLLASDLLRK